MNFLQLVVIASCGFVYWRVARRWRSLHALAFSTGQKWLATIGWCAFVPALALWLMLVVLAAVAWLGSIGRTGPDDAFTGTFMVAVFALPVSLFLTGMTSMAFDAIDELADNAARAKTPPSAP